MSAKSRRFRALFHYELKHSKKLEYGMTLKNDIRRGFILPTVLLFLTGLGALAVAFALGLASEGQLSENLKRSDQEKLILLSAVEHVKALFLAAEINYPGSWLREGRSGPYVIGGVPSFL